MTQTIAERILAFLHDHREGVDDDELAEVLNLRYRQQANARCHQLAREGTIERRVVDGKIKNFWRGLSQVVNESPDRQDTAINSEPWFWEGSVQETICRHLRHHGYSIVRCADTRRRQAGKDIEASKGGPSWVTVKGYPKGTPKTRPTTQARHWFKQAFFDMVDWRHENQDAEIAIALPDFPTYRRLAEKVVWLQDVIRFSVMWVGEDGTVQTQGNLMTRAGTEASEPSPCQR